MTSKNCVFALLAFLFTFSCRTILEDESEHYSSNNIALVSIKVTVEEMLDNEISAKSVKSSLSNGAKYTVQAFDYKTGQIVDWKVNTTGVPPEPLRLDIEKSYDIVIYSFNSSEAPPRVSSINERISYDYTDNTKEFLYYRISNYSPKSGANVLMDIVLKNKFSYAKFVLDAKNLSTHNNNEVSISGIPKLSNVHFKSGRINVNNGNFSGDSFRDLYFPMTRMGKNFHESDYIPIVLESGSSKATFTADIIAPTKNGDEKKTKNIQVTIEPGTRKTYTMKFIPRQKCTDPGATNNGETLPCQYPPKPIVSISSVSDKVLYDCRKSFPCPKKVLTFDIYVTIANIDESRHKIYNTIEWFVTPDVRYRSFIKTSKGSYIWTVEYTESGGTLNNIGDIKFVIRVYDNKFKRFIAHGISVGKFCKFEDSNRRGKCLDTN